MPFMLTFKKVEKMGAFHKIAIRLDSHLALTVKREKKKKKRFKNHTETISFKFGMVLHYSPPKKERRKKSYCFLALCQWCSNTFLPGL